MSYTTFNMMRALRGIERNRELLMRVQNSRLSMAEKQKVFQAYRKAGLFALIYGIFMVVSSVAIGMIVGFFFAENSDQMIISCLAIVGLVVVEMLILVIVPTVMMKEAKVIIKKMEYGFDGRSNEELAGYALNAQEMKAVSKYKVGTGLWCAAMYIIILVAIILFYVLDNNVVVAIAGTVMAIFCYAMVECCQVNRRKIESGHYKKEHGYYCSRCRNEVAIPYHLLESYNNISRNASGIRILYCSQCGNQVPLYGFDKALKEYRNYKMKYMNNVNNVNHMRNTSNVNNVYNMNNMRNVSNVNNVYNMNNTRNVSNVNNVYNMNNTRNVSNVNNVYNMNNTRNVNNVYNMNNMGNMNNVNNINNRNHMNNVNNMYNNRGTY